MSDRVFLDTNILVYAIESADDPNKWKNAVELTQRADVCISTQVLCEFYQAVTSPRRTSPLKWNEAVAWVQLWKRFDVRDITVPHVDLALEITGQYQLNYYDALILASAHFADCPIVYSEDLNDGQDYIGIRIQNPFR